MDNLYIKQTRSSPLIFFNATTHVLLIKGESYPENAAEFYGPVFDWLKGYLSDLSRTQTVTLMIEMIYFNSSSSKVLMNLFDVFEAYSDNGLNTVINWHYDEDNDAAMEYGEEFAEDFERVTFNLVSGSIDENEITGESNGS